MSGRYTMETNTLSPGHFLIVMFHANDVNFISIAATEHDNHLGSEGKVVLLKFNVNTPAANAI